MADNVGDGELFPRPRFGATSTMFLTLHPAYFFLLFSSSGEYLTCNPCSAAYIKKKASIKNTLQTLVRPLGSGGSDNNTTPTSHHYPTESRTESTAERIAGISELTRRTEPNRCASLFNRIKHGHVIVNSFGNATVQFSYTKSIVYANLPLPWLPATSSST